MTAVADILSESYGLYVVAVIAFIISENRNRRATLAWILAFVFLPGLVLLFYLFFGRDRKACTPGRHSIHLQYCTGAADASALIPSGSPATG